MGKMLHGVLIRDGKLAVVDMEDDLDTFYHELEYDLIDIVGREIAGTRYEIICDDEGLFHEDSLISMMDEKTQTPLLVGNLFICNYGAKGELDSLSDEDVTNIKGKFKYGAIWGGY